MPLDNVIFRIVEEPVIIRVSSNLAVGRGVFDRSVSPNIEVTAETALPSNYDVLRIFGDVVMTSTPTIVAGHDLQLLTIIGVSDSAVPTLQSDQDLPGSTLRFQFGQSFRFGKNDSLEAMYDADQGLWLEQRRTDLH